MRAFEWCIPDTLEEAVQLLSEHPDDARVVAGGTALVLMMRAGLLAPKILVDLNQLPGLNGIEEKHDGSLTIGALVTHRDVERCASVQGRVPTLALMARQVANLQVRNQGTLVGNLCHADPAADPPAVLLSLDAQVRTQSPRGGRVVPLDKLFVSFYQTSLQPDEVVAEVIVPAQPRGAHSAYLRYATSAEDRPLVAVSVMLEFDEGRRCRASRIAIGAVGPVPIRVHAAESALRGQALSPELVRGVAAMATERLECLNDVRGSRQYRREMTGVCLKRALLACVSRASEGGVAEECR